MLTGSPTSMLYHLEMDDYYKPVAGLCRICDKALRPGKTYAWREVKGWQQLGPNGVPRAPKLLTETGAWECQTCHMTTTGVQGQLL